MSAKPFVAAVTTAVTDSRDPDSWQWYLPRSADGWRPAYTRTALHSLATRSGPGWSDAVRATMELRSARAHPELSRRWHARMEAGL